MEDTKFIVSSKTSATYSPDLTVYCVSLKSKDKPDCSHLPFKGLQRACKLGDFKGDESDVLLLYGEEGKSEHGGKRVAFIGTGIVASTISNDSLIEKLRITGGNIAKICRKLKAAKVCVIPPQLQKSQELDAAYGLAEGMMLGDYSFQKYKKKNTNNTFGGMREVKFVAVNRPKMVREKIAFALSSSLSAYHARDMANEPGDSWTPESFANYAKDLSRKHRLKCKVFNKKEIQEMGMGGILAVNRGSATEPKLVVLEYRKSAKADTILLVGKGLTFDSGGVSLKPAAGMQDMKYDMCGGAAVLAAMNAVGLEKPDCNVIAIVPSTDNMSGASAVKPGDIIYHYNKISSEIINTDAEGRLILADALAYGIERYKPDCVIDLATLTGAVIVGLGHHYTGLLSNNDALVQKLVDAGAKAGEPLWRLPLGPQYSKQIESKIADIKNTGGKSAGTITAAEYLQKFVNKTPWAHLDIAGTAWGFTEKSYIAEGGPSGTGVRTLIELLRQWRQGGLGR